MVTIILRIRSRNVGGPKMRWVALLCEKLCLLKSTLAIQQQNQEQNMFISPHLEV